MWWTNLQTKMWWHFIIKTEAINYNVSFWRWNLCHNIISIMGIKPINEWTASTGWALHVNKMLSYWNKGSPIIWGDGSAYPKRVGGSLIRVALLCPALQAKPENHLHISVIWAISCLNTDNAFIYFILGL